MNGQYRKKTHEVYSVQFKLDVLSIMKRIGASQMKTALHFNQTNPSMISSWKKKFVKGGEVALDQPKGRPPMSHKSKNITRTQPALQEEMTREQKLERALASRGSVHKKGKSFSDGSGRVSRKAQTALSFELKEEFRLKDVLEFISIPESSY
ncbi:helix-turn-helix domain-containing protein [Sporosarcina sp. P30]|uniref:helix-turn-helix domain-containing protein n=1 Tax=unclassified Sporosarcina TaxID=2647733 RepID=UPI003513B309